MTVVVTVPSVADMDEIEAMLRRALAAEESARARAAFEVAMHGVRALYDAGGDDAAVVVGTFATLRGAKGGALPLVARRLADLVEDVVRWEGDEVRLRTAAREELGLEIDAEALGALLALWVPRKRKGRVTTAGLVARLVHLAHRARCARVREVDGVGGRTLDDVTKRVGRALAALPPERFGPNAPRHSTARVEMQRLVDRLRPDVSRIARET